MGTNIKNKMNTKSLTAASACAVLFALGCGGELPGENELDERGVQRISCGAGADCENYAQICEHRGGKGQCTAFAPKEGFAPAAYSSKEMKEKGLGNDEASSLKINEPINTRNLIAMGFRDKSFGGEWRVWTKSLDSFGWFNDRLSSLKVVSSPKDDNPLELFRDSHLIAKGSKDPKRCLTVPGASTKRKTVEAKRCEDVTHKMITMRAAPDVESEIVSYGLMHGLYLSMTHSGSCLRTYGTELKQDGCRAGTAYRFRPRHDGKIESIANTGLCIHHKKNGGSITMDRCEVASTWHVGVNNGNGPGTEKELKSLIPWPEPK